MFCQSSSPEHAQRRKEYTLVEEAGEGEEAFEEQREGSNVQLCAAGCTLWALQLVWSTIFARGTSYLMYIGIPMTVSALLWICGPLAGMVVQPVLGAISDSYETSGPGRNKRKPFILGGAIATSISMIGLAWTPNAVVFFVHSFGPGYVTAFLALNAFFWVSALSISVQPLQGGIRTLLHEICSKEAQARFSSLQGVVVAFGIVCGYFLAALPLGNRHSAWSQIWQFQNLTIIVSAILLTCATVTVICPYQSHRKKMEGAANAALYSLSLKDAFKRNADCLRSLPRSILLTLQVQFFSWIGWFPALYYQTEYLASLYQSHHLSEKSSPADVANHATLDSVPHTLVMLCSASAMAIVTHCANQSSVHRGQSRTSSSPTTLVYMWLTGHVVFAVVMGLSFFATTEIQGIWLLALIGIPRALSSWIPFALVGRAVTMSHNAGTLTSLHNAALSAPQILSAGLCATLFAVVKALGDEKPDVARWAMSVACFAGIAASWRSWHLLRELRASG